MGLGDCLKCVKFALIVFNFIFCLIGLAILGFGVFMYVSPNQFADYATQHGLRDVLQISGIIVIVIGSIIAALGFLGCCGAMFENRVLLVLFFVLLLLIFLCLITLGVFGIIGGGSYRKTFEDQFKAGIAKINSTERAFVDSFQKNFICCGWILGDGDYINQAVPPSCRHNTTNPVVNCAKRYDESMGRYAVQFIATVFVTAAIAFLGLVFSMMLCCAITDLA